MRVHLLLQGILLVAPSSISFLYEVSFPLSQTQSNMEHRYWNQSAHVAGEPVGQVRWALPSHVTKRNPPPKEKGHKQTKKCSLGSPHGCLAAVSFRFPFMHPVQDYVKTNLHPSMSTTIQTYYTHPYGLNTYPASVFFGANFCTLVTRKNPVLIAQRFSLENIHKSCHILGGKKKVRSRQFFTQ